MLLRRHKRESCPQTAFLSNLDPKRKRNGAAREIRTPDPLITNEVLYQLSYCGVAVVRPERPAHSLKPGAWQGTRASAALRRRGCAAPAGWRPGRGPGRPAAWSTGKITGFGCGPPARRSAARTGGSDSLRAASSTRLGAGRLAVRRSAGGAATSVRARRQRGTRSRPGRTAGWPSARSSRSAVTSSLMVEFRRHEHVGRRLPDEGVEAAGHRRDRRPAVGHDAVGDPGRVARRAGGAGEPLAAASGGAVLGLFEVGHEQADPHGRALGERAARAPRGRGRTRALPCAARATARRPSGAPVRRASPGSRRASGGRGPNRPGAD